VVRSTAPNIAYGFERFGADSVLQVRTPHEIKLGRYVPRVDYADTLSPDSMTFYFTDDTSRCQLTWSADTLFLTRTFTNGTFSFGYLRSGDARWYRMIGP
jgi:hypothetical protein